MLTEEVGVRAERIRERKKMKRWEEEGRKRRLRVAMDTRNGPEARRRRRRKGSWKVEERCERIRDEVSNMKGSVERGGPGGGGACKGAAARGGGAGGSDRVCSQYGCTNKMLTSVPGRDLRFDALQDVVSRNEKK